MQTITYGIRATKTYIESELNRVSQALIAAWNDANPCPEEPLASAMLKEAMEGKIIWNKKETRDCACNMKYNGAPDWSRLITTPLWLAFEKQENLHKKRQRIFRDRVAAAKKLHFEAVIFQREDFLKHRKQFEAFK